MGGAEIGGPPPKQRPLLVHELHSKTESSIRSAEAERRERIADGMAALTLEWVTDLEEAARTEAENAVDRKGYWTVSVDKVHEYDTGRPDYERAFKEEEARRKEEMSQIFKQAAENTAQYFSEEGLHTSVLFDSQTRYNRDKYTVIAEWLSAEYSELSSQPSVEGLESRATSAVEHDPSIAKSFWRRIFPK